MRSSVFVVAVLVAVCAVQPSAAFFQDLLLQPLQHIQHVMQPQQPQQPPQYYQYQQYRRSTGEPQTLPVQHGVYSNARPVVYQWQQPQSYGSAYSYGSNPLSSLLQTPWLPWASASRQPPQPQPLQPQPLPLSAPVISTQQVQQQQQQQPQQPLQAFWAFLPWNSNINSNAAAAPQQPGPILSFLQNPSSVLPWGQLGQQQGARPGGLVYTTPLAPSHAAPAALAAPVSASLSAAPALQVVSEASPASPSVKSVGTTGLVLDDIPAAFSGNGIRRIALHDVHDVHADGLPCAQDA